MPRYSGIVQSVEQRTVKFGAVQEKVSEKTAEICGFFNIYSPNTGYNFWKKVRVFYAVYCFLLPILLQKLYADIRNTQTYVFAYAKLWCFYTWFTQNVFTHSLHQLFNPAKYRYAVPLSLLHTVYTPATHKSDLDSQKKIRNTNTWLPCSSYMWFVRNLSV